MTLLASPRALALQPASHRKLAERACANVGLPDAFCRRMGQQVFETDNQEWKNLAAHAQRELGQDRCSGADAAIARVEQLAREAVAKTRAADYEAGAVALGRAIHTLQDECAHHGMTNEEHAYYSLTQTCTELDVSPDTQPEALACAEARTRKAFAAVARALAGTRWDGVERICLDFDDRDSCQLAALPTPVMACHFLAQHADWDGEDSRWNGELVGPALVAAFAAGLVDEPATRSLCAGDPTRIDPPAPRTTVTELDAGCRLIDITCLGKVDEDSAADDPPAAGCSSSRGSPAVLVLVALAVVSWRRRFGALRAAPANPRMPPSHDTSTTAHAREEAGSGLSPGAS
jgi:hypothetical protein